MTDFDPTDVPFQSVTLDDDRTIALFVPSEDGDTRVFFDMGVMVSLMLPRIERERALVDATGISDPTLEGILTGKAFVIRQIAQNALNLMDNYDAVDALAEVQTIADMFPGM